MKNSTASAHALKVQPFSQSAFAQFTLISQHSTLLYRVCPLDCRGWQTPIAVFNVLDAEFCFSLDVAASHQNAFCVYCQSDSAIWCSPFYSHIATLEEKAAERCDRKKYIFLIILLSNTFTVWFSFNLENVYVVIFNMNERLSCVSINFEKQLVNSAKKYLLFIWRNGERINSLLSLLFVLSVSYKVSKNINPTWLILIV